MGGPAAAGRCTSYGVGRVPLHRTGPECGGFMGLPGPSPCPETHRTQRSCARTKEGPARCGLPRGALGAQDGAVITLLVPTLVLGALGPGVAPPHHPGLTAGKDQALRAELAWRTRAVEEAWMGTDDAERRSRALPHVEEAVQRFFRFESAAVGASLGEALAALQGRDAVHPLDAARVHPGRRLVDAAEPGVDLVIGWLYGERPVSPLEVAVRCGGVLLAGPEQVQLGPDPSTTVTFQWPDPTGAPEGDLVLDVSLSVGAGEPVARAVTLARVPGMRERSMTCRSRSPRRRPRWRPGPSRRGSSCWSRWRRAPRRRRTSPPRATARRGRGHARRGGEGSPGSAPGPGDSTGYRCRWGDGLRRSDSSSRRGMTRRAPGPSWSPSTGWGAARTCSSTPTAPASPRGSARSAGGSWSPRA